MGIQSVLGVCDGLINLLNQATDFLTKRWVADSEAVSINYLAGHIEKPIISTQVPKLANGTHGLQDFRVATNLDLRLRPEEAEILGIMFGKPCDLWMLLGVSSELLLPAAGLLLGNNAANDDTTSLADGIS